MLLDRMLDVSHGTIHPGFRRYVASRPSQSTQGYAPRPVLDSDPETITVYVGDSPRQKSKFGFAILPVDQSNKNFL